MIQKIVFILIFSLGFSFQAASDRPDPADIPRAEKQKAQQTLSKNITNFKNSILTYKNQNKSKTPLSKKKINALLELVEKQKKELKKFQLNHYSSMTDSVRIRTFYYESLLELLPTQKNFSKQKCAEYQIRYKKNERSHNDFEAIKIILENLCCPGKHCHMHKALLNS